MAAIALVQIRFDEKLRFEAEKILAEERLTLADVVQALLVRTVRDNAAPHDLFLPNDETIAAMQAARRGEVIHAGTIEQFMADLHADD